MAKRRTAAQKRATRRMIAANRARARSRRAPARRKNPIRRRRRNPTPVARKRRSYRRAINISNPRRRRRRRSNPMGNRIMRDMVQPSLVGAGGAILVDVVMGYVPLPAMLETNAYARAGVKGLAAVGLALLADQTKMVSRRTAQQLGVGSLTVTLATLGRDVVNQMAPDIKLDGLGYYTSARPAGVPRPDYSLGVYVGGRRGSGQLPNASRTVGTRSGMGAYGDGEMSENGYNYG